MRMIYTFLQNLWKYFEIVSLWKLATKIEIFDNVLLIWTSERNYTKLIQLNKITYFINKRDFKVISSGDWNKKSLPRFKNIMLKEILLRILGNIAK